MAEKLNDKAQNTLLSSFHAQTMENSSSKVNKEVKAHW